MSASEEKREGYFDDDIEDIDLLLGEKQYHYPMKFDDSEDVNDETYPEYFAPSNTNEGECVHVKFLGANTLLVSDGITEFIIDPYFTRQEVYEFPETFGLGSHAPNIVSNGLYIDVSLSAASAKNLDAILVTHTHWDHALDASAVYKRQNKEKQCRIIGSKSLSRIIRAEGVKEDDITIVAPGNVEKSLGDFTIYFLEASHIKIPMVSSILSGEVSSSFRSPARVVDYKEGTMLSFLVEHKRFGSFLHLGSAAINPGYFRRLFTEALASHRPDTIIVAISGWNVGILNIDHQKFFDEGIVPINPKRVYFSHWDDYERPMIKKVRWSRRSYESKQILSILNSTHIVNLRKEDKEKEWLLGNDDIRFLPIGVDVAV